MGKRDQAPSARDSLRGAEFLEELYNFNTYEQLKFEDIITRCKEAGIAVLKKYGFNPGKESVRSLDIRQDRPDIFFEAMLLWTFCGVVLSGLRCWTCSDGDADTERGKVSRVAMEAFRAGFAASCTMVRPFAPDVRRGQKTLTGAKRGHAAVHGSRADKERRWIVLQAAVDELRAQYPHKGVVWVRNKVARKCRVSTKTIARRTIDRGPERATQKN